jgi:hypothetical protein
MTRVTTSFVKFLLDCDMLSTHSPEIDFMLSLRSAAIGTGNAQLVHKIDDVIDCLDAMERQLPLDRLEQLIAACYDYLDEPTAIRKNCLQTVLFEIDSDY